MKTEEVQKKTSGQSLKEDRLGTEKGQWRKTE